MPTRVRSFSKVNLGLAIGPVRGDGFHGLQTLYQTLDAHDLLTVSARRAGVGEGGIAIRCENPAVPCDERNTIWKMLRRAMDVLEAGGAGALLVAVELDKRLPVQGGMGAGSANAAAALLGLERELGVDLGAAERLRIAAEVGSDVPLFLLGGSVLGTGRGEEVFPVEDVAGGEPVEVVVALPEIGVSTPAAFKAWDQQVAEGGLTAEAGQGRLAELSRVLAGSLCEPYRSSGVSLAPGKGSLAPQTLSALVRTGIANDFEQVVFQLYPSLRTIKEKLAAGALYAALSGSGSALFGLYASAEAAEAAERRLGELGVRSLRTRLLGRAAYWTQMFPA